MTIMTIPILFLDIDGVVNVPVAVKADPTASKEAMGWLHHVLDVTGASVVLSSAWRLFGELPDVEQEIRNKLGYTGPPFVGRTEDLQGLERGHEIALWLALHMPARWAAVDDNPLHVPGIEDRLVRTNPYVGIDAAAADQLIALLGRKG